MKNNLIYISLALLLCISISCNKKNSAENTSLQNTSTVTISDKYGEIQVPKSPKRVVVFSYGAIDMFDALGLSENMVGFPQQLMPSYLKSYANNSKYTNVGGVMEPNFDIISSLKPDLIIIEARQEKFHKEFSDIAPTLTFDIDYNEYLASVTNNVKKLGKIYGIEEQAESKLAEMTSTLAKAKEELSARPDKGLIVMYNNGKFSAFGVGSRFGFIHSYFGVKSVPEDLEVSTHGNSISAEYILEKNPDVLYVVDRNAAVKSENIHKDAIENKLIKQTNAYKNGKIIYLTPDIWYLSGGGLEASELMAEELLKAH